MFLRLASVGNPDFGQNSTRPLPGVRDGVVPVADYAAASVLARKWIEDNDLGGGNWSGGQLTDEDGALVGRVAYNGRVFGLPTGAALFDPYSN